MSTVLTDLNNLHEHPFCQLGDKVAEICTPLFNSFPINYFNYMRRYPGNKIISLPSNKKMFSYYLPKKDCPIIIDGKKIRLWTTCLPTKVTIDMASTFGYYNGVLLEKVCPDYIEKLEFASPSQDTSAIEFCTNKELLNQFFLYFKEKASDLIKTLEREPLYLPESRFLKLDDPDQPYNDFCQAIKTKRLPFKLQSQEVIFTRREFEIMSLLIKGKSMREVARILKISPRTVEAYLYKAKNKTNLYTVSRLLDQFANSLF